jgi:hypothetical protein
VGGSVVATYSHYHLLGKMAKESIIQLVAAICWDHRGPACSQTSADFVTAPAAGPPEKSHNYFVVCRPIGRLGIAMGRIGQIALGALVAVCISGVSAGMDGQLNARQPEFAARQLERLCVDAKIVEGTQSLIRSLLNIAD